MTRLNLPLPGQISTNPGVNNNAMAWAALTKDLIEHFLNNSLSIANRAVAIGSITVTWPGGGAVSNSVAANHGLGTTPIVALAIPNDQVGTGICAAVCFINATQVTAKLETAAGFAPLNTATTPVSWIAIA